MFKTKGKIIYDPPRPGLRTKNDWWVIAEVDRGITEYYRYWVRKKTGIDLSQPSWDAHVSIIRGEEPADDKKYLWKKYHNKEVELTYSHIVRQSGDKGFRENHNYFFVEAYHPLFKQIRAEFGYKSDWNQHVTIGRSWVELPLLLKYN